MEAAAVPLRFEGFSGGQESAVTVTEGQFAFAAGSGRRKRS